MHEQEEERKQAALRLMMIDLYLIVDRSNLFKLICCRDRFQNHPVTISTGIYQCSDRFAKFQRSTEKIQSFSGSARFYFKAKPWVANSILNYFNLATWTSM